MERDTQRIHPITWAGLRWSFAMKMKKISELTAEDFADTVTVEEILRWADKRIDELESQLEIAREHLDFFFRLANDKGISDQGKLGLVRCKVKGKTFTDFLATLDKKPEDQEQGEVEGE